MIEALAASIAGPVLGGVIGYNQQRSDTQVNIDQAREARAANKELSDTAHQREVEDLKKAGLNPILSATKGAGAPVGTSAAGSAQANATPMTIDLMSALKGLAEIKSIDAQTEKTQAETKAIKPKAQLMDDVSKGYKNITGSIGDIAEKLAEAYQDWLFRRNNPNVKVPAKK